MIKSGKLSAARDPVTGGWMVEPAELHRLYQPAHHEAEKSAHHSAPRIAELEARLSEKNTLVSVHERTIDDMHRRLDTKAEERRRLTALLADRSTVPAALGTATRARFCATPLTARPRC